MANYNVNYEITGKNLLSGVLKQVDADAERTEQSISKIGGDTSSGLFGNIVGANLLTGAIQKTTTAVVDFAKSTVDEYAKTESYEARLATLLGDRRQALMALNTIKSDAAKTPFDVESLVQGNSLLIGAGANAGEARKSIMDLGNAIAATGGGADELSRMSVNLAQIRTLGKASALDIKQFAYANIPIYQLLSKSLKKPIEEVKKMDVSYKELTKALSDARAEGGMFYNGLENASNTLKGLQSNLDDVINSLKSNVGESFSDSLKEGLRSVLPILDDINNTLTNLNKSRRVLKENNLDYKWYESNYERGTLSAYKQKLDEVSAFGMNGEKESLKAKSTLQNELKRLTEDYKNNLAISEVTGEKAPDAQRYLRQVALLKDAIAGVGTKLEKAEDGVAASLEGAKKDKLGTGVTIEAQQPKNQYITINGGLVHQMTIESVDGDIPSDRIKNEVSTHLIELFNDAYTAMR